MKRIVTPPLVAAAVLGGGILLARTNLVMAQEDPMETTEIAGIEIPAGYTQLESETERTLNFTAAETVLNPGSEYAALIQTSAGTMLVELHADLVPNTVNNFVFLALNRYYDGIVFHRVLEDFMAQTGDPTGTGTGGPGYEFADEFHPDLRHDAAGVLSMANAGPGTNGSQFFITFRDTPHLDDRHSVFGRVTEGMDVLDQITRIDPQQPNQVVLLSDTLATLAEQGIELPGDQDVTLEDYLEEELGAVPARGRSFDIAGRNGMIGATADGQIVAGFWPTPDFIERVIILERAAAAD